MMKATPDRGGQALVETNFRLPGQSHFYRGKVRDVYTINNELLVMIASDRISAFDVVLPAGIPYKGQVLNQLANKFLDLTADIVPNWKISSPDPMVTIGQKAQPFKVEMVIRGYLTGHAWRTYRSGNRSLCGVPMPEGMHEHDAFPDPIITPSTKADQGHDEDISRAEILAQGLVNEEDYLLLENYTHALYKQGQAFARKQDLILVDTKYEFGKTAEGKIVLIDEIHTPDSSRYFYRNSYEENQRKGLPQKQLSKEFVRQWLISNGFQGRKNEQIPEMTKEFVASVSERYIELYENITGEVFVKTPTDALNDRIERHINEELDRLL
ncbi:MAG: phosphoribosylaminoimidazolesuccinocarboxamide synthase [Owenweeksia sp.]|nr:phosphoribosylaminoimidazolesuccinocarboxamide synthase [Owenweeksia sp.]